VASLDRAHRILAERKFRLSLEPDYLRVAVEGAGQMAAIVDLFNQNGLDCEVADVVDQVYQG
jgi:hypothetical protein